MIKYIIGVLIAMVVTYLSVAFISADYNIFVWDVIHRSAFFFFSIIFCFVSCGIIHDRSL